MEAPVTDPETQSLDLSTCLHAMTDHGAEALHLTAGAPPWLKVKGEVVPLKVRLLTPDDTRAMVASVLTDAQHARLLEGHLVDFSFGLKGFARFTCCAFQQRGAVAATFRMVPFVIPPMPAWLEPTRAWVTGPAHLCVVAGHPSSGRSSVLAQWVDHLNVTRRQLVLMLEQPITFLHPHKNSAVNQVELGADVAPDEALALARTSGANTVVVAVDDDLKLATSVLRGGQLVLASVTATSAEAARALLGERLRPFERDAARLVWLDHPGVGRLV
jgi:twitching motility protein PilT